MRPQQLQYQLEKALEDLIAARHKQSRELEIALASGHAVHAKLHAILAMVQRPEVQEALKLSDHKDYLRQLLKQARLNPDSEISPLTG